MLKSSESSEKFLIVSLHDVHPGSWAQIQAQIDFLAIYGVTRCSLLLVPDFHHEGRAQDQADFCAAVTRWQNAGHDIVLHGFYHDRLDSPKETWRTMFWTRFYTNQEAEFLDLPLDEARVRLLRGLEMFSAQGWKAHGFVAPAWLMAEGLTNLLAELGFTYTNRLRELIPLRAGVNRIIHSQSLCYSTRQAWRRTASGFWNKYLFGKLRETSLVRLSLHPRDLEFPLPKRQIDQILRACFRQGFVPTTYADYVAR